MSGTPRYVLDADSFIRAKREHYAFDICPGYWDALLQEHHKNRLVSILPVRKELTRGTDALAVWVKNQAPGSFFESVGDASVQTASAMIIQWVQDNKQYSNATKQKFASGADPWLVAFASTKNLDLVTYEVSAPESKWMAAKLPDVARQFNVKCVPPYVMLRQLKVKLSL